MIKMIKVQIVTPENGTNNIRPLYYVKKEDTEKLEAVLKRYNIKVNLVYSNHTNQLMFWKEELDDIEKQWKQARKQDRQK